MENISIKLIIFSILFSIFLIFTSVSGLEKKSEERVRQRELINLAREKHVADKKQTETILRETGLSQENIDKILVKMDQTFENALKAGA